MEVRVIPFSQMLSAVIIEEPMEWKFNGSVEQKCRTISGLEKFKFHAKDMIIQKINLFLTAPVDLSLL